MRNSFQALSGVGNIQPSALVTAKKWDKANSIGKSMLGKGAEFPLLLKLCSVFSGERMDIMAVLETRLSH